MRFLRILARIKKKKVPKKGGENLKQDKETEKR